MRTKLAPDVALVVPSRERARWLASKKRRTLDCVKELNPTFMVRDDDSQLDDYAAYARARCVQLRVYDARGIRGAAQTYDYIIDRAIAQGRKHLVILDDDFAKFAMHNPVLDAAPEYKIVTTKELDGLLSHATKLVSKELPMLSFTPIMKRTQDRIVSFCKPMMMAYVAYLPHFEEHPEHRFWQGEQIEARCDLNLSLKLLTEGYLTAFMCTLYVPDNVNNPGGCSVYRDLECELRSVDYLLREYPDVVTRRVARGWLDDAQVVRWAPKIAWKRAFNHAAFERRFGYRAVDFANELVAYYERLYSDFIKELRFEAKELHAAD